MNLRSSALFRSNAKPKWLGDYYFAAGAEEVASAAGAISEAAEEVASAAGAEEDSAAGAGVGAAACSLGAHAASVREAINAARAIVVFMLVTHCVKL